MSALTLAGVLKKATSLMTRYQCH